MAVVEPKTIFQDRILKADQANYLLCLSWIGFISWVAISDTFNSHWDQNTTPHDVRAWCIARRQEFQISYRQFKSGPLHVWYADVYAQKEFEGSISVSSYVATCLEEALNLFFSLEYLSSHRGASARIPRGDALRQFIPQKLLGYEASGLWALSHWQGRRAYMYQLGRIRTRHRSPFPYRKPGDLPIPREDRRRRLADFVYVTFIVLVTINGSRHAS